MEVGDGLDPVASQTEVCQSVQGAQPGYLSDLIACKIIIIARSVIDNS